MLQREERIKAERLGEITERHVLREYGGVGVPCLRQQIERNADFHDAAPRRPAGRPETRWGNAAIPIIRQVYPRSPAGPWTTKPPSEFPSPDYS